MAESFNLERFADAQEPVYADVLDELRRGRKESHWMWFIFPQIKGLGHSEMAQFYGISSRAEADAYLHHPILGPRLDECTHLVNAVEGQSIRDIFGGVDALKFRSSMTLFCEIAGAESEFARALEKYFSGEPDGVTLSRL